MVTIPRLSSLAPLAALVVMTGCGRDSDPSGSAAPTASQSTAAVETDHLLRARRLFQLGDFDSAADSIYKVLVEEPDRGEAVLLASEIEAARGHHQRSVELAASMDVESRLGQRAVEIQAEQYVKLQQPSAAADVLLAALKVMPEQLAWRRQAWALLNQTGRREEASSQADALCRSGEANQRELHSLVRRTEAYPFELDDNESPEDHFDRGLGMARWYFSRREFDRALEELRLALDDSSPLLPAARALQGRLLAETQSFETFAAWHAGCDDASRDLGDYWAALGTFFLDQRQIEAAARALLEAVYRNPSDRLSVQRLSKVFGALERRDDSEQFRFRGIQIANSERAADEFMGSSSRSAGQRLTQLLLELGRPFETIGWTLSSLSGAESSRRPSLEQQRVSLLANRDALTMPAEDSLLGINRSEFDIAPAMDQLLRRRKTPQDEGPRVAAEAEILARPNLVNVANKVGIRFQWYKDLEIDLASIPIHESVGGGIAVLDYDLDGWPDVYLAQGSGEPPTDACTRSNELFRNLGGTFESVTAASHTEDRNYSSGIAAGDVNQDGFPDLYLGSLGRNRLLVNNGDGTFRDVTARMNTTEDRFTASLAIADIDGDHLPDLFEGNYIEMEGGFALPEIGPGGREVLPSPLLHYADSDRWFSNRADGGFTPHVIGNDVASPGTALGIIISDFDGNGTKEVFVGNDVRPNHFLFFQSESGLRNGADAAGVANSFHGTANGCMGIATGDFDRNGTLDMHIANYINESANLYLQSEGGGFIDQAIRYGVDSISWPLVGFGTKALDVDRNGWIDVAVTNGHIFDLRIAGHDYQMPPQLMMSSGGRFELIDVEDESGYWDDVYLGRSMAMLDYDRSGSVDLIVGHLDKPAALLENRTLSDGEWIQFELIGTVSERDAVGARVTVTAGDQTFSQWMTAGDGYLCTDEPMIDLGIGKQNAIDQVEILWPSGKTESLGSLSPGHRYLVIENEGQAFRRW